MAEISAKRKTAAAEPADVTPPASGEIVLENRYRLLVGSRLPEFDLGGAEAVTVSDDRNPGDALFARVCAPDGLPRLALINNLKHMREAKLLRPIECGTVPWPGTKGGRIAVVFQTPEHGALFPPGHESIHPMQTDDIRRYVLGPACLTLGFLTQRSLTHRGVRPDNMYWDGASRNSILLGDCVTHPPAAMQPVVYEPIESAMTPPLGRGHGSVRDDFYSLGVSILALATGKVPLGGMKDEDVIAAKLKRGSYAALMDGARPPFGLRELLRGLLADNPEDRWGMEQLEQWIAGGLRTTVQEMRLGAAERPFEFEGKDYSNFRSLAHGFGMHWQKAGKAIQEPGFEKWLSRTTTDGPTTERVSMLFSMRADSDKLNPDQVAQASMYLDSTGPIRYKGLFTMPSAMGVVLADAFARKDMESAKAVGELITGGLALKWHSLQSARDQIIYEAEVKELKMMQQLLRHSGPGYGIERCLYNLNPAYACQSEILKGYNVLDIRSLLPALEKIVSERSELVTVVDRHLTAFIAARIKASIDRLLSALELAQGDAFMTKLGMLSVLAAVQQKHGPNELPYLTEWLARELEPAIGRIHGKSLRDQLRKRLNAVSSGGSLVELHNCLNNESSIKRDEAGRKKAMREFAAAAREIGQLESKEFHESAQRLGWRIASGISAAISFGTACFVVFL